MSEYTHNDYVEQVASGKYAPRLDYLCDDPECCENGCPIVTCRHCKHDWPCDDYINSHTPTQIEKEHRYVDRKSWGDDIGMIEHFSRQRGWEGKQQ